MSEQQTPAAEPEKTPEQLSAELQQKAQDHRAKIIAFLTKKRTIVVNEQLMQAPCTGCGAGSFSLITTPNTLLAQNVGEQSLKPIPFVSLLCGTCGALQIYSLAALNKLIETEDAIAKAANNAAAEATAVPTPPAPPAEVKA